MKLLKLTILFYLLLPFNSHSQEIHQELANAFNNGKASMVMVHSEEEIDLILPRNEGTYNKDNASNHLETFFTENPPVTFEVVHQGKSPSGSSYIIGELNSKDDLFRVYMLFSDNVKSKIVEIRVEKNE